MEIVQFKQDSVIAAKNEKVKNWYLIQQGTVIQKTEFSEIRLEKNAVIGFLERDIYLCDYVAAEDTVLAAFACGNSEDLKNLIAGQNKARGIFLRAALVQRHQLLCLYSDLSGKMVQLRNTVGILYNDYKTFCSRYRIPEKGFSKIEQFRALVMQHRAERWEVSNSVSIIKNYMQDYLQLIGRDDSMTVGVIMEAAAQMRRFTQGIFEMESYLSYNKGILLGDSGMDLFQLFFDLSVEMHAKKHSIEPVEEKIRLIAETAEKLQIYNGRMVSRRLEEFREYDYVGEAKDENQKGTEGYAEKEMDLSTVNCVRHILKYADYTGEEIDEISDLIDKYFSLPDLLSTDSETYALRRKVTAVFYEIYYRVFVRAVKDECTLTPILKMFLNFGFMKYSLIGEEQVRALYNLCAHLEICQSKHIFTIYEWLKCIYEGSKETSKNEFDKNYPAHLLECSRTGEITKEEMQKLLQNPDKVVEFEIQHMFTPVNKLTYGKVTTFCPILCESDLINSVDKMLVTAEKLETALNEVRKLDYSLFYREVPFSDLEKGINSERVMREILPDIILMPNAGSRAMMWQETVGARNDTSARFMFPIFTSADLPDLMMEVLARYRWEMCRKIEGIYWNDFREKSLTAEYCAYLQFYRKNNELSTESKEKIKNVLARAKNNYREVFVRDYVNMMKFESRGSYRLNKIARDILIRYCPFVKSVRDELRANPFYQMSITRCEAEAAKKLRHYQGVYQKYDNTDGENAREIRETVLFYEM